MRADRRDFIKLSMLGASAASTLGVGAVLPGCGAGNGPAPGMKWLRPADVELIRALVPAVLEGAPGANDPAAIEATVGAFDQMLEDLSEQVVGGVQQAFDLLNSSLTRGFATGQWSGWRAASPTDSKQALGRLRDSGVEVLNAIYGALTRLVISAWYGQPVHAATTGYPGPPTKVLGALAPTLPERPVEPDTASPGLDAGIPDAAAAPIPPTTPTTEAKP